MNAVQEEVAANKPTNRARPGLEVDEQDNVADYMEASPTVILTYGSLPDQHDCDPLHLACTGAVVSLSEAIKCVIPASRCGARARQRQPLQQRRPEGAGTILMKR